MALDQARKIAQRNANDRGKAITICKLNPYGGDSVVLREHEERDCARWWFIEVIRPEGKQ